VVPNAHQRVQVEGLLTKEGQARVGLTQEVALAEMRINHDATLYQIIV